MSGRTQSEEGCRISIHENSGYCYASTQQCVRDLKTGQMRFYRIHWDRLEHGQRFIPNMRYLYASKEERADLIFPMSWDMRIANELTRDEELELELEAQKNCFRGDEWLLRQIMEETGISRDFRHIFCNNPKIHVDFTSLIHYFLLEKERSLSKKNWRMKGSRESQPYLSRLDVEYMLQSVKDWQYQYFAEKRVFQGRMGPKERWTEEEYRRRRDIIRKVVNRIREIGPNWRNRAGVGILLLAVLQIEEYLERVWRRGRENGEFSPDYLSELRTVRCIQHENKLEFSGKNLNIAEEVCMNLKITKWLVFYKNRRRGRPPKNRSIEGGV